MCNIYTHGAVYRNDMLTRIRMTEPRGIGTSGILCEPWITRNKDLDKRDDSEMSRLYNMYRYRRYVLEDKTARMRSCLQYITSPSSSMACIYTYTIYQSEMARVETCACVVLTTGYYLSAESPTRIVCS